MFADLLLVVLGISLSILPWVFVVSSPLYMLAVRNRNQPLIKVCYLPHPPPVLLIAADVWNASQ